MSAVAHPVEYPFTQLQDYSGEPVKGEGIVEFRLLYIGRVLGASRNDSRAGLKHEIRRHFHPQLRRLWETNSNLQTMLRNLGHSDVLQETQRELEAQRQRELELESRNTFVNLHHTLERSRRHEDALAAIGDKLQSDPDTFRDRGLGIVVQQWKRNGFSFLPLVTEELCLRCSLDILFLRPEEPGMLINSGDIDGRVKTIFDALRMPKTLAEAGGMGPQDDENPFYCLLEDDKLISEVRVTTDQLLLLPAEREIKPNDAVMVITVKVKPARATLGNTFA